MAKRTVRTKRTVKLPIKKVRRKKRSAPRAAAVAAPAPVLLVNMVPKALSGETQQDSEPMLTVDPAEPLHIVGTAFTPDPMGGANAPIYASTDGGNTWTLNAIVPGGNSVAGTGDITVAFSGGTHNLYGGILRGDVPNQVLNILRSPNFAGPTTMTALSNRSNNDQPFTQATSVASGPDAGKDRVYVGNNDFLNRPRTATIDVALDAAAANPAFTSARIEKRTTIGQNGPQVRPTVHPDGTVYATFYGWRDESGDWQANTLRVTADVVVVRDDNWGNSAAPFEALTDPGDNLAGMRVAKGVEFAFNIRGKSANGQQRLGGALAIAVDPRDSATVYLAWGDEQPATGFTVHVQRSTDRGVTWSNELRTLAQATNAALAINSDGVVGLLFQQLTGTGSTRRWVTHFQRTSDGTNWTDLILATTLANVPVKTFDPYLGDYAYALAVGKDFYGIFSAANIPDTANFPNGVTYQRNADFTTHTLLAVNGTTHVQPSIDPFFFRVTG